MSCATPEPGQAISPAAPGEASAAAASDESGRASATTSTAAASTGPGVLDAEIVATARDAHAVEKVKIRARVDGAVTKLAVYHEDANRIPEPVRKLAAAEFPGATVASYETEMYEDGSRVYEVELRPKKGEPCEVAATAEGTELYRECEIPTSKLPKPVAAAIHEQFPKGKIEEAEHKKRADGTELYSVELTENGTMHYVYVSADGAVQKHLLRVPAVLEVRVD